MPRKLKTKLLDEANEAARYLQVTLISAIEKYPNHPLEVVPEAKGTTLSLDVAIVELRPTIPFINLASNVAGFFVRGTQATGLAANGEVAIEAVVRDLTTGEIFMAFKDRETDKNSPFTLKDFQQYAHVRAAMDDWANETAEILASLPNHKVREALPLTIDPRGH